MTVNTSESIADAITLLERAKGRFIVLALLWPCRHCGAEVDQLCCRPNGEIVLRRDRSALYFHAPRLACAMPAFNSVAINSWRRDLEIAAAFPPAAERVHRQLRSEVERSRLWRRLKELGRLNGDGADTAFENWGTFVGFSTTVN